MIYHLKKVYSADLLTFVMTMNYQFTSRGNPLLHETVFDSHSVRNQ